MLVHHRDTPSPPPPPPLHQICPYHLYIWIERSTVRVTYLAEESRALSAMRAQTRIACSGVENNNHDTTLPPYIDDLADFHRLLEYLVVYGNVYAYLLCKIFNILNIILINFVLVTGQLIYEIRKHMRTIKRHATPVWLAVTYTCKAKKDLAAYLHLILLPRLHFHRHHHLGLKK